MASLKAIRKRIVSVKSTQKVTKAMQMIAAARLRKAQMAALGARAYAAHVKAMALRLAERSGPEGHPFLRVGRGQETEYLVITSDRGLCGGFNENLLRKFADEWKQATGSDAAQTATVIGRKGRDYFRAKGLTAREHLVGFYEGLSMATVLPVAEGLAARFLDGTSRRAVLIYNRFRSAIAQDIIIEELLPMVVPPLTTALKVDYIYEPSRAAVVDRLLTRALGARIYQALLESVASELAARMTAMDNATKNAADMIQVLTMQFNRARQAAITKELMDIVNGAESLKK
ncbi:MAG: ATP synthase F1 subunit gamma [Deltaproteobacteria bacterium]|nr:ATP synthase F1 subunit gamma [Deltaproteobacteria bacterium]